MSTFVIP